MPVNKGQKHKKITKRGQCKTVQDNIAKNITAQNIYEQTQGLYKANSAGQQRTRHDSTRHYKTSQYKTLQAFCLLISGKDDMK